MSMNVLHTPGRQRGAALVELALIIPLLLVLTMITTEFGRAMYQYNLITKSVRDAVRYLAMQTPGTHIAEAQNLIIYGSTVDTGTPLVPDLVAANVAAPAWTTQGSAPVINVVTVRVENYCFRPLFASVFGLGFNTVDCANAPGIPFSAITATMRAQL
jgi:Flp pilus assembly protein TadG